jgi:hypothetical protein
MPVIRPNSGGSLFKDSQGKKLVRPYLMFFFLMELRASILAKQLLYHLSHSTSPRPYLKNKLGESRSEASPSQISVRS